MSDSSHPAPAASGESLPGASTMAMYWLLATLGVLFVSSVAFYLLMRVRLTDWPPSGAPPLPLLLWVSTFVLVGSSMTIHYALHSVRQGRMGGLKLGLGLTFAAALVFLLLQVLAWTPLLAFQAESQANLYKLAFVMLAGLHAAHVVGGLIPLGIVTAAAARNAYTAQVHLPVKHVAMYWHFLDVVWVIIFIVLQVSQ